MCVECSATNGEGALTTLVAVAAPARRLAPLLAIGAGALVLGGCGGGGSSAVDVWIEPEDFSTRPVTTAPPAAEAQPTATDADGQTRSTSTQTYVVRPRDYVFTIAERFDVDIDALVGINDWESAEAAQLFPGDTVQIPPNGLVVSSGSGSSSNDDGNADAEADEPEADDIEADNGGGDAGTCDDGSDAETYEIVANDNPSKVADANGVTLQELQAANEGNSAITSFRVGEEIFLPC